MARRGCAVHAVTPPARGLLQLPAAMGRHLDDMLRRMEEEPPLRRRRRPGEPKWWFEQPEGLIAPPRRPITPEAHHPFRDPLARIKQPLRRRDGPEPGGRYVEFTSIEIIELRHTFHATQRQFARMFGISVETLRNWEQNKRRPHGPARALLRVAKANPNLVARTLLRYRRCWWME
jgi:putative transcriptional regulator